MILLLLLASFTVHSVIYRYSKNDDKIFQGILLFSNLYFCGGSYFFWFTIQETYFAGLTWGEYRVGNAIMLLTVCTTIVSMTVFLLNLNSKQFRPVRASYSLSHSPLITWFFFGLGLAGSIIVFVDSIRSGYSGKSSIFLIAYQFSDLLIPVIIYLVATKGISKINLALISYFVIYSIFVGFRYKIALLIIPLISLLFYSNIKKSKKIFYAGLIGLVVLTLFTLLTLFRSKFSGIDLSRNIEGGWASILYGFFAESNIIFGLASIVLSNIESDKLYYFQPFLDIFREFVPRFLDPSKSVGEYIRPMQVGFFTFEGENSGTAYPFIGEYGIMFGWSGIAVGVILFSALYTLLRRVLRKFALTGEHLIAGLGLISAVMAYFNYSRGFLPAVAKSYIFIIFAYIVICVMHRKMVRLSMEMPQNIWHGKYSRIVINRPFKS